MTGAPDLPPLKAVFLDRDGVLNIDHGYVHDPAKLDWIDGAREAVAAMTAAGLKILVVTNQSGIGRGYFDELALDRFHAAMQAQLAELGGRIDSFYHCPFHELAVIDAFRVPDHPDRKPNPGMVLRGLADWDLRPEEAVIIGDRHIDVEAGARAGMAGHLFKGGNLRAFVGQALGERVPALK
ncbi:HAD family hydrolase [Caulobacter segnis]|uniref:D,D-heptose 1,7-bisphosphate phosphatase n=1 Tax=Caulobacter segnis TaxID=88688 RepID=A0A2W5XDL3_9CAUL|nr:HAD family hydrolase [Caulobacter segnis]PZR35611.1 MAG: D,D-heptose 1,7-bisphosphate phosphatase [Caulobacter segnis]